jgi:hypothetical protein
MKNGNYSPCRIEWSTEKTKAGRWNPLSRGGSWAVIRSHTLSVSFDAWWQFHFFLLCFVVRGRRSIDTRTHARTSTGRRSKIFTPHTAASPITFWFLTIHYRLEASLQGRPQSRVNACHLRAVRLFVYIVSASTGRICMKLCIGDVY